MADDQEKIDVADTAPLEEPPKPQLFKVKLIATAEGEQAVSSFTYPRGDGFGQWSLAKHGLEVEFADISHATAFLAGAIETGGLAVADDSPVKLK